MTGTGFAQPNRKLPALNNRILTGTTTVPQVPDTTQPAEPPVSPQPPSAPVPPVPGPAETQQPPAPPSTEPPKLTEVRRQELQLERDRIVQEIARLQALWQRKKWLDNVGIPNAIKTRTLQFGRTFVDPVGKVITSLGTDPANPLSTIANGVKDKLGIKTSMDKIQERNPFTKTGVDVPQSEIIKSFKNADDAVKDLKAEFNRMPSDEQMKDEMHRLTSKMGTIDDQLAGGK